MYSYVCLTVWGIQIQHLQGDIWLPWQRKSHKKNKFLPNFQEMSFLVTKLLHEILWFWPTVLTIDVDCRCCVGMINKVWHGGNLNEVILEACNFPPHIQHFSWIFQLHAGYDCNANLIELSDGQCRDDKSDALVESSSWVSLNWRTSIHN